MCVEGEGHHQMTISSCFMHARVCVCVVYTARIGPRGRFGRTAAVPPRMIDRRRRRRRQRCRDSVRIVPTCMYYTHTHTHDIESRHTSACVFASPLISFVFPRCYAIYIHCYDTVYIIRYCTYDLDALFPFPRESYGRATR